MYLLHKWILLNVFILNSSELPQTKGQKYLHDRRRHFVQYDLNYVALH